MAIKLTDNAIHVGNYIITEVADGIRFTGILKADKFQPSFQGTVAGFTAAGYIAPTTSNVIDKFPFATDTNATDHGDTVGSGNGWAGQSSTVYGFASAAGPSFSNVIQKYPFSTASNASDVGDLTQTRTNPAGNSSDVSGYTCGGYAPGAEVNTIDKFPFSTNTNATDVGDLQSTCGQLDGQGESSTTHGYVSGGSGPRNQIQRFPFASDVNSVDVGDLATAVAAAVGASSTTHGYTSGGSNSPSFWPSFTNVIQKFTFAANSNASSIGNLSASTSGAASISSANYGYATGGQIVPGPPGTRIDSIDKFPFAADSNATDIGNLTQARTSGAGAQD